MAAGFTRNPMGKYSNKSNVFSIFFGEKAYLLEDELNELQELSTDKNSSIIEAIFNKAGILSDYTIYTGTYDNIFYIDSMGMDMTESALLFTMHGRTIPIGSNSTPNQPVDSMDNRLIIEMPATTQDRHDLVILETWLESINFNEGIHQYGGETTPLLTDYVILDPRINAETSRRLQFRWRIRVIPSQTDITLTTAFNYSGTDTGVRYTNMGTHYMADTGIVKNANSEYITDGQIHAIPLFVVHRNSSSAKINLSDIQVLLEHGSFKDELISLNFPRMSDVYTQSQADARYVQTSSTNNNMSGNLSVGGTLGVTGDVDVKGNLTVEGQTFVVDSSAVKITDSFITLNSGQNITTSRYVGLEVDRSANSEANVELRWNETNDDWELTNDGTNFYRLLDYRDYHTHTNKNILDEFSENSNNQLLWNGTLLGSVQKDGTLQVNLNSDMVDGLHGSQFVRSDTDSNLYFQTTISGNKNYLTFSDSNYTNAQGLFRIANESDTLKIEANVSAGRDFSSYTTLLEMSTSGLKFNGSTIWNSSNDGSGSGLDADLLDGLNSTQFVRIDANNTMSAVIDMNGYKLSNAVIDAAKSISLINDYVFTTDANTMYLKNAAGTAFKALSIGALNMNNNNLKGVSYLHGQYGTVFQSTDAWLRLNPDGTHTSGIYMNTSAVRTDGALQVGANGQYFQANSSGTNVYNQLNLTGGNREVFFGSNIAGTTGASGFVQYYTKSGTDTRLLISNAGGTANDDVYISAGLNGNGRVVINGLLDCNSASGRLILPVGTSLY